MALNSKFLGAYVAPRSPAREYSAEQLRDPAMVNELFDYCQILEGVISGHGWRHLLAVHGLQGLLEIDRTSGWFAADPTAATEAVKYQCLIAGWDPETDTFGVYEEASGVFVAVDGSKREVHWGMQWTPASSLGS